MGTDPLRQTQTHGDLSNAPESPHSYDVPPAATLDRIMRSPEVAGPGQATAPPGRQRRRHGEDADTICGAGNRSYRRCQPGERLGGSEPSWIPGTCSHASEWMDMHTCDSYMQLPDTGQPAEQDTAAVSRRTARPQSGAQTNHGYTAGRRPRERYVKFQF